MAILQVVTDVTGLIGVQPQNIYIKTTDTLAEVLTPGYLNQVKQQGYSLSNWQIAEVYGVDFNNGQPGSLLFQVQTPSNPMTGNYSLVSMASAGEVILPVTAGHLAAFANGAGAIEDSEIEFVGGFTFAGTLTGNTAVTFPTSGTLATTAGSVASVSGTANIITSTGGSNPVIDISPAYVGQTSITTLGAVTSGTWDATTIAIAHGGTGVTAATTAPTANAFAAWDANLNLSANNFIDGYATTVTAAATTTLTVASARQQYFTGTTTQVVVLPVVSTLVLGQSFYIVNNSTGAVTVESSGANTVQVMAAGTTLLVTCILLTGTTAASWNAVYSANVEGVQSVSGTTNIITSTGGVNPVIDISAAYVGQTSITTLGTIATGTWAATTVAIAHGGTGVTSVTTAPTATAFAGWDANSNLSANNHIEGYTTTVTANGTTTLTVASTYQQYFTGTDNQTVVLPVASTLILGQSFLVINNSNGVLTVNSSGGNTVQLMNGGIGGLFTCILASGTTAASWGFQNLTSASTVLLDTIVTPSVITGMHATPHLVLPALAEGSQYMIQSVQLLFSNTNAFAGGGSVYFQYGSGAGAANSDATQRLPAATFIDLSTPTTIVPEWTLPGGFSTNTANFTDTNISSSGVGLYITNDTAPFTGGASNLTEIIIIGCIFSPQL